MSTKSKSYRQAHRAPDERDAPLYDVTANGVYPTDFYERSWQYLSDPLEHDALPIVQGKRGRPDKPVLICRAVPKGVRDINPGDWVSIVKKYARLHGKHATDPAQDMPVICARAKARDLHTEGNSLLEWGYTGAAPLKATVVFRPKTREQLEKAKAAAAARRDAARAARLVARTRAWRF